MRKDREEGGVEVHGGVDAAKEKRRGACRVGLEDAVPYDVEADDGMAGSVVIVVIRPQPLEIN